MNKETFTDLMWKAYSPYDNPYQGDDKKVLFVCSAGILRSATAARLYAKKYNTRAAGSAPYALIPVTGDLLLWANEVVFVNPANYEDVSQRFDLSSFEKLSVKILDIPDMHNHMAPELIEEFNSQYEKVED